MPTTVQAIYEDGVLKPLEPLSIDDGTLVEVTVTSSGEPSPGRRAYQMIAAIAALPLEVEGDEASGRDHDTILYAERDAP